ncbi:hypothetical protein BDV96DRAFT_650010 [Lophiotrema nucula]|uniref:MalT-like TPR region domain-containing protein n=1 Tax=Lophiotrema nucula TaxID=690887 RepID=A0A6A5YWI5_9PLEO|nr:hypothetical protein BDV96DRAFT_650010 [Lophiotrema nucula]
MTRQVSSIHDIAEENPDWNMNDEGRVRLAEVLKKCSWYHHERGNFDLANRTLQLPKAIAGVHPNPSTSLLSDIYFQQAWLAAETMDRDTCMEYSLKHLETRLELERNTKPALTQSSAMAYSILALANLFFERYADVGKLVRDGLAIYYAAPETDRKIHWAHFFVIHQAWALVGLGQAADAVEKLEETIEWGAMQFRKTKKPSFKHGYTLQTLASIRFLEGNFEECSKLNRKAIRLYQETVRSNMHHVGDAYTKLAECKIRQSQPENALGYCSVQSIRSLQCQLARALFIQGGIQEQMNDQVEAESSYEHATDLYVEITHKGFGKQPALKLEDFTAIVPVWAR